MSGVAVREEFIQRGGSSSLPSPGLPAEYSGVRSHKLPGSDLKIIAPLLVSPPGALACLR